jgi:hypothetical protein
MTWDQFLRWLLLPAITATGITYLIVWVRCGAMRAGMRSDRRESHRHAPSPDDFPGGGQ